MGEDGEMNNGSYLCPRRVLASKPGGPRKQPRLSRLKRDNKKLWGINLHLTKPRGHKVYRFCSPGAQG